MYWKLAEVVLIKVSYFQFIIFYLYNVLTLVVKTTVMMADITDYGKINEIYGTCKLLGDYSLQPMTAEKNLGDF